MGKISTVDLSLKRQVCPVVYDKPSKDADDIVQYEVKEVVKKVGDGEEDFVIEKKVVESSRVNRQTWIAKDEPDVGILNILEKVRRSGDITLFNQTHQIIPEGLQDYTNVPGSIGEALKSVESGANSYAALKAIFGDISYDQLATMSADELNQYLENFIAKNQPHVEEKGEDK